MQKCPPSHALAQLWCSSELWSRPNVLYRTPHALGSRCNAIQADENGTDLSSLLLALIDSDCHAHPGMDAD